MTSSKDQTKPGLGIDGDDLAACVGCGLCLPHCPTYRVTRDEAFSPRGRIAAMREVQDNGAPATNRFVEMIDSCVQCVGCETACPSGVPYGRLIDQTRRSLAQQDRELSPRWLRLALIPLAWPKTLRLGSALLAVVQRVGVPTTRFGVPALPLRRSPLKGTGTDVWLHTGCVMDAWYRPVHQACLEVLTTMGIGARLPEAGAGCCGALQHHAGDEDRANKLAESTMAAMPGTAPILVDSAGCGAALKDYGQLLGTAEADAFSKRVFDVQEFVADNLDKLPAAKQPAPWSGQVAIQDPCHLRHVQRCHQAVEKVLAPYGEVTLLDDEGLCCGAGGSFSLQHPDLASGIRQRKHESIQRSGATMVASANPGCSGFLETEDIKTVHPMVLLAEALSH